MNLDFDLDNIASTEFGVGRDATSGRVFVAVPANNEVQTVLRDMVVATVKALERVSADEEAKQYDPSEKFGSTEHIYLCFGDEKVEMFRHLHLANNLDMNANALTDISQVFCYFARFTDNEARRLTALRRPAQFKSLGKRWGLIQILDDTLTLVKNPLFKLDNDFDLIIDSERVRILRPSGFEFIGKLQEAIQTAVPQSVRDIQGDIPYVNWEPVEQYATTHVRAARYLASIRSQGWAQQVDFTALRDLCENTGVSVTESNGQIIVSEDQVMGFLEVLDRRRYEIELVSGAPERFRAASRERISVQG